MQDRRFRPVNPIFQMVGVQSLDRSAAGRAFPPDASGRACLIDLEPARPLRSLRPSTAAWKACENICTSLEASQLL